MKIKLTVLLLLAQLSLLFSVEEPSFFKTYLVSYPHSVKQTANAPETWKTREWVTAGGVMLIAGGLYFADPELRNMVQASRTGWGDALMSGFSQFGDGAVLYPAAGAAVMAGCLAKSEKTVDTGLLSLKSMFLASVVTQGLKLATQRPRPNGDNRSSFWSEAGFSLANVSFPSGHSSLVWSLAPIMAEQYSDKAWVAPLVYGLAILGSYSRLNDDKHWASDVFTGAVIGYISARLTLKSTPRLAVSPTPQLNGISLSLEF